MQGFSCHCPERQLPVEHRNWGVVQRLGNASAFNGYRWQSSLWSNVLCLSCGAMGRTKAAFVDRLPDVTVNGPHKNGGCHGWGFKHPEPDRDPAQRKISAQSTSTPTKETT